MTDNPDFPTTVIHTPDGDVTIEKLDTSDPSYDPKEDGWHYDYLVTINDEGQFVGWWSNRIYDPLTDTWSPTPPRAERRWGAWSDWETRGDKWPIL